MVAVGVAWFSSNIRRLSPLTAGWQRELCSQSPLRPFLPGKTVTQEAHEQALSTCLSCQCAGRRVSIALMIDVETLTAHIRAQLHQDPTPAQIAAHFGVNRFALSRWFRAETGLSLRDYIAALKIEQGIAALVQGRPVIESQQEAGHASAATFSHRFRAHTGLAPSDYRQLASELHQHLCIELGKPQSRTVIRPENLLASHPHTLTVHIEAASAHGVVFAGLFPEPIPRGMPVRGAALFGTRQFQMKDVPDGLYYLLACEITPSLNPLDFFRLDHCLRALHPEPISFPLPAPQTLNLPFRPMRPSDPPITVNLPKLLADHLRQRNP
ncbi:helix-turn-helix transcriptional regulator [Vandammella animalimorsus]|nr:helix-turn-helix transcriptional regulator [Vandammella animalimorsus]